MSDPDLGDGDNIDVGDSDDDLLSPGSTATGSGTTEADVTDGREQKLPRVD
jgi:hypothetical protein